jgi:hypothetical protein
MLTSSCRLHPAYRTQLRGKLPAGATWRVTTGRCCNRSTAIHGCTCARAGQAGHATASCWLAGRATDAPPPWARTRSPAWATCQHPSGRPMILPTDPRERAPYARRSPGPGHVAVVERSGRGGAAVHGRLAGQPAGSPACTPVQPLSAAGHHPERIGCSGFGPQRPVLAGLSPATWHPMVRSAQGCSIPKGSPPTSPCL